MWTTNIITIFCDKPITIPTVLNLFTIVNLNAGDARADRRKLSNRKPKKDEKKGDEKNATTEEGVSSEPSPEP